MASLLAGEMILKEPIPGPTMVMGVMRGGGCPAPPPPPESELYLITVKFIYVAILM